VSGADVVIEASPASVTVVDVAPGALLGDDPPTALREVEPDGSMARLAYARAGRTAGEDFSRGVIAVVTLRLDGDGSGDAVVEATVVFTDAAFNLHGPFEAEAGVGR
jgi:hypothetical protein